MTARRIPSAIPATAAVALAAALAACGSGDDKEEVERTVNGVYDALAAKDAKKVCGSLTDSERKQLEGGRTGMNCEASLRFAFSFAGRALQQAKDAKVTKVEVDGDTARATVTYRGSSGDLGLSKEDGEWKINDLDLEGSR